MCRPPAPAQRGRVYHHFRKGAVRVVCQLRPALPRGKHHPGELYVGVCSGKPRCRACMCRTLCPPLPLPLSAHTPQDEGSLLVANAQKFDRWFNVAVQENTEV